MVVVQLERPVEVAPDALAPGPRRPRSWAPALVLAVAAVLAAGGAWVLRGSPFPPNGFGGDEAFRLASVARDAAHLFPSDFAYRGLPVFYPPFYFFLLGRLVALTGMAPYEALKIGTITVAFLVPVVGFALWRRVTGDVVVAAAVVVAGLAFTDWWEPYSWIAVVAFVPWWLAFVVRVGDPDRAPGVDRRRVVTGAVIGGLIAMTYYYPFFIGAVHLAVVLVVARLTRRRGRSFPLRVTRESWCVLAGTALVTAPFWAPLAIRAASTGAFDSLQNRYFEPWMIPVPLPFLDLTVPGAVMLFGLVSIVVGSRRSPLLLGLGTLLAAAYAWFVIGYVMVLADTPVLAFKTVFVIDAVLVAGAGIGAVALIRNVAYRGDGRRFSDRSPVLCGGVLVTIVVVLMASAVGAIPYVGQQRAAHEPEALLRAYDRATAGRPDGDVVLTAEFGVLLFRPVYVFNLWNANYSNPTAEFAARSRFLARLAAERDPAVVAAALRHNRYDGVDVVLLDRDRNRLTYVDYQDNFPRGTRPRILTFSARQFDRAWFARSVVGDFAVFVARGRDPLGVLDAGQRRELARRFAGDLSIPNRPSAG